MISKFIPNIEKRKLNVLWLRFKCLSLFLYVDFTLKRSFKTGVKIPVKWIWLKYMTCTWGCLFMNTSMQAWDVLSWEKSVGWLFFRWILKTNEVTQYCPCNVIITDVVIVMIMLISSIFTLILKLKQFIRYKCIKIIIFNDKWNNYT